MELHQIQYFQTVARTQHFTQAAELLSISQPALSRSISKLETELGAPLFERRGRNVVLNHYGELFLQRVERAIEELEVGKREIQDLINPDHGTVALAFLHSLGSQFVPELLSSFRMKHANVNFQLYQAATKMILEQLRSGKIDLALTSFQEGLEGICWEPLLTEELFLIVSIHHPLAQRDQVELSAVAEESFIAFKGGYGMRTITDKLCQLAGFSPRVTFEGEEIATVAGLVAARLGVALVPDVKVLDKTKVKLLRVSDPPCSRTIGVAWAETKYMSPVTKVFLDYVKSSCHTA
jgi:DNA-binding transcriptional LysR family regulator